VGFFLCVCSGSAALGLFPGGAGDIVLGRFLGGAGGRPLAVCLGGTGGFAGFAFDLVFEELEVVVVFLGALALGPEVLCGSLAGFAVGGRERRRIGRDVRAGADDGGESEARIARVLGKAGLGIGEQSLHGLELHLGEAPGVLGGLCGEGGPEAAAIDGLLEGGAGKG
jgi:hypothetical protein